jgi:hypothetical protein
MVESEGESLIMRLAHDEYPKLEAIWLSDSYLYRFKLEDKLLGYTRAELEQLELFIWAQLTFGNKQVIKDVTTAKTIRTIINEILGEEPIVQDGYRVIPSK